MAGKEPGFMKSEYFIAEPGNWHLKPGAPEEVRREFEEFMVGDEADPVEIPQLKPSDLK
jgi:hypothetical protein